MGTPAILSGLVAIPLVGAAAAALVGRRSPSAARWTSLAAAVALLALAAGLWVHHGTGGGPVVFLEQRLPWIPRFGVSFHLALDGLNILFVLLTGVLGCLAVLASWREIDDRVGAHYLALLVTLAGAVGVFLAHDLVVFYVFWELMLVPMIFLIGVWGHGRRIAAAMKFAIFTMASSLLMLVAILALYAAHGAATGEYTMELGRLRATPLPEELAWWLHLGFVAAFAVKLPVFPLHSWLPDAHTEAPTAGSILLAGLLLKTGGYGLIRFAGPLFPEAAGALAAPLAVLGVAGILYGALLAFAQEDLKRLIAYTSISHMGFVALGIAVWQLTALQGAVVQMLAHGVATGALFAVAGMVEERLHTRRFRELGGLWGAVPRLGAFALLFALAALGLPGLGNFVGEFLVLVGSFPAAPALVAGAAVGLVLGAAAALLLIQRAFHGGRAGAGGIRDLGVRETAALALAAILTLALGLVPQAVLRAAEGPLERVVAVEFRFDPLDPDTVPSTPRARPALAMARRGPP